MPESFCTESQVTMVQPDQPVLKGTVRNVIFNLCHYYISTYAPPPTSSTNDPSEANMKYTIQLDDNTTCDIKFKNLVPHQNPEMSSDHCLPDALAGLPSFLSQNAKITMNHDGSFEKGF